MKPEEIRKKTDEQLEKMLRELRLTQIKASSKWSKDNIKKKEAGINIKGAAKQGQKTSYQKEIRKNIARILTEINMRKKEKQNASM